MKLEAAFIFLSPAAGSENEKTVVDTQDVTLTVVAARDYKHATSVARELVSTGVKAIELCGGFGHAGTAMITQAVADKAQVGVVRFDCHPGLEGASGDSLFSGEPDIAK